MSKVEQNIPEGYNPFEDEYMSSNMLEYFKTKLESLHAEIIEKENSLNQELEEIQHRETDHVDQAINEELRIQDLSFYEHEKEMLVHVNEALAKIESGSYGFCETTDEPIGVGRLCAAPWARYSIEVQRNKEKENA